MANETIEKARSIVAHRLNMKLEDVRDDTKLWPCVMDIANWCALAFRVPINIRDLQNITFGALSREIARGLEAQKKR